MSAFYSEDFKVDVVAAPEPAEAAAVCGEFETARLFLNHFGFAPTRGLDEQAPKQNATLHALNGSTTGFLDDLAALDATSIRSQDTVVLFYVKQDQRNADDILRNSYTVCICEIWLFLGTAHNLQFGVMSTKLARYR